MSLLMDALKRAEANKQEAGRPAAAGGAADALRLEPLGPGPATTTSSRPPDNAPRTGSVDVHLNDLSAQDFLGGDSAGFSDLGTEQRDRAAVRNAFAAKSPTSPTPSRRLLGLVISALGVAALTIGGYVWYELHGLNRNSMGSVTPRPAPAASPVVLSPAPPRVEPAPDQSVTPPRGNLPSAAPAAPPASASLARPAPANAAPVAPKAPVAGATIRLSRTPVEPDAAQLRGHASVQLGQLDVAQREFEHALHRDPHNSDTLLALAAIAQRQGKAAEADTYRQRAWLANPADPAVQAAILGSTAGDADPLATESRLKTLLAAQPESGPLNFALGNLYARQQRWGEAQQAYFSALATDGDNPDYLFNQAVSLDQLRQPRLAAQHYRMALEAASRRPSAFDPSSIERRLGELESEHR